MLHQLPAGIGLQHGTDLAGFRAFGLEQHFALGIQQSDKPAFEDGAGFDHFFQGGHIDLIADVPHAYRRPLGIFNRGVAGQKGLAQNIDLAKKRLVGANGGNGFACGVEHRPHRTLAFTFDVGGNPHKVFALFDE